MNLNPFDINPTKNFEFENQYWSVKIPNPKEGRIIDVETSKRLNGASLESLPTQTYNYTSMCVTLNYVIKDCPMQYKEVKDWEEYPDMKFVIELYSEYDKQNELFYKELEELKKNRLPNRGTIGGGIPANQTQSNPGNLYNVPAAENRNNAAVNAGGYTGDGSALSSLRPFERAGKVESIDNLAG